jgi:uncharacterized protein (TIGR03083 family)
MDVAGIALRDQVITFDITPREALDANAAQRRRFVDLAASLDDKHWTVASRCSEWTVQDVVRHVTQMAGVTLAALRAAQAGERFVGFTTFDPKATPKQMVRDAGPEEFGRSAQAFSTAVAELLGGFGELDPDDDSVLVITPAGRQPWPRASLHSLFDSAVHERDVAAPLGLAVEPSAAELTAIAAYQVLLAARMACWFGLPLRAELHLDGAAPLTAEISGAAVSVTRRTGSGALQAHGDAVAVLDAMTGRGELAAALDAPPDVIAALGSLSPLI